jgi:hypothetical protein
VLSLDVLLARVAEDGDQEFLDAVAQAGPEFEKLARRVAENLTITFASNDEGDN